MRIGVERRAERGGDGLGAVLGDLDDVAEVAQDARRHQLVDLVVVHDQDPLPGEALRGGLRGAACRAGAVENTCSRVLRRRDMWTGLVSAVATSAACASARLISGPDVIRTSRVPEIPGVAEMRRASSSPSRSGMHRSRMARSYGAPSSTAAPSRPSAARAPSTTSTDTPQWRELVVQDRAVGRVVVDHQHPQPGEAGARTGAR